MLLLQARAFDRKRRVLGPSVGCSLNIYLCVYSLDDLCSLAVKVVSEVSRALVLRAVKLALELSGVFLRP